MKLALIAQLRDELDIVEAWLRHIDALFDVVYIIDHQSIDGTSEVLKQAVEQRKLWNLFFLNSKADLQAETSNLLMHEAFNSDIDYLFFLDADEFIMVQSRDELEKNLEKWQDHSTVCSLYWKNCVPEEFSNKEFTFDTQVWIPMNESLIKKIILPKEVYYMMDKKILISRGNHTANTPNHNGIPSTKLGNLLHVPIRSRDQVVKKVFLKVLSNLKYKGNLLSIGIQFKDMLEKIAKNELTENDLRGFIIGYEKPKLGLIPVNNQQLYEQDYSLTNFNSLKVVYSNNLFLEISPKTTNIEIQIANALNNYMVDNSRNATLFLKDGEITLDQSSLKRKMLEISVTKINSLQIRLKIYFDTLKWMISRFIKQKIVSLFRKK